MTVDGSDEEPVRLGDGEGDPVEEVDVGEEATFEEVHDALVEEERRRPLPHVAGHAVREELLQTQGLVPEGEATIPEISAIFRAYAFDRAKSSL